MKLQAHIPIALAVSTATYFVSKSIEISVWCFIAGIFIDLDHLFDYFITKGIKFDIKDFFDKCYRCQLKKYYILFHSYEFIAILAVITYLFNSNILSGITIGSAVHLFLDVFSNSEHLLVYSFIYRLKSNFDPAKLPFKNAQSTKNNCTSQKNSC
ncbi:MAG: hypothetical protein QME68_02050 [Elusimicrobiota bacterium]|nr:hypothetical protein [Elusimicrobiota bacterium]